MQLVLIGGVKGVGKTTVVDALRSRRPEWDYAFNGAYIRHRLGTMPFSAIRRQMMDDLLSRDVPLLVVDTHYTRYRRGDWVACWPDEDIKRMAESPSVETIQTYSLYAGADEVYARRVNDPTRERRLDHRHIVSELLANERHLQNMNAAFDGYGKLRRTGSIANDDAVHAATTLERLIGQ